MKTIKSPNDISDQTFMQDTTSQATTFRKITEYNPRFNNGGYFSDAEKFAMTNYSKENWNFTAMNKSF